MKERTKTLIMFAALATVVVGSYAFATHRRRSSAFQDRPGGGGRGFSRMTVLDIWFAAELSPVPAAIAPARLPDSCRPIQVATRIQTRRWEHIA